MKRKSSLIGYSFLLLYFMSCNVIADTTDPYVDSYQSIISQAQAQADKNAQTLVEQNNAQNAWVSSIYDQSVTAKNSVNNNAPMNTKANSNPSANNPWQNTNNPWVNQSNPWAPKTSSNSNVTNNNPSNNASNSAATTNAVVAPNSGTNNNVNVPNIFAPAGTSNPSSTRTTNP